MSQRDELQELLRRKIRRYVGEFVERASDPTEKLFSPTDPTRVLLNFLEKCQQLDEGDSAVQLLQHFGSLLFYGTNLIVLERHLKETVARADLSNEQRIKLTSVRVLLAVQRGELEAAQAMIDEAWPAADTPRLRAKLYNRQGVVFSFDNKYGPAREAYEAALQLAQGSGEQQLVAAIYNNLGDWACFQDFYEEAAEHYRASAEAARGLSDMSYLASAFGGLAVAMTELGRYEEARHYHQQACEWHEKARDARGLLRERLNLSYLALHEENAPEAKKHADEALRMARHLGDLHRETSAVHNLGHACLLAREYEASYEHLSWALEERRRIASDVFVDTSEAVLRELMATVEADPDLPDDRRRTLLKKCRDALDGD